MTAKSRIEKLEKAHGSDDNEIVVNTVGTDPDDPNYLIINPFSPNPRRISKVDYDAENERKRQAGIEVTIVEIEYVNQSS